MRHRRAVAPRDGLCLLRAPPSLPIRSRARPRRSSRARLRRPPGCLALPGRSPSPRRFRPRDAGRRGNAPDPRPRTRLAPGDALRAPQGRVGEPDGLLQGSRHHAGDFSGPRRGRDRRHAPHRGQRRSLRSRLRGSRGHPDVGPRAANHSAGDHPDDPGSTGLAHAARGVDRRRRPRFRRRERRARFPLRGHVPGAGAMRGEEDDGVRDRRGLRGISGRHRVPLRRGHGDRRHGPGLRRDGGSRVDRERATATLRGAGLGLRARRGGGPDRRLPGEALVRSRDRRRGAEGPGPVRGRGDPRRPAPDGRRRRGRGRERDRRLGPDLRGGGGSPPLPGGSPQRSPVWIG